MGEKLNALNAHFDQCFRQASKCPKSFDHLKLYTIISNLSLSSERFQRSKLKANIFILIIYFFFKSFNILSAIKPQNGIMKVTHEKGCDIKFKYSADISKLCICALQISSKSN